jgi:hypothetical protein
MRLFTALAVAGLLSGAAACTPAVSPHGKGAAQQPSSGALRAARIGDAEFAAGAYQILLDGERSPKRTELLAGVVRHQLARAGRRFAAGNRDAGLSALTGALLLMRVGELRPEMLEGGGPALRAGAAEVSRVGNEGRALALYGMLRTVVSAGP